MADGLALASFVIPNQLAVTPSGAIYVCDGNSIRLLRPIGPAVAIVSVTNAASNLPGPIAPGEIVTIYGGGIGPNTLTQSQSHVGGVLDLQLADTRVLFNGIPAPVIYASYLQTAAIVPYSISGSTAEVTIEYRGAPSPPVTVPLAASSPGIFTVGAGNVGPQPARPGQIVQLFVTGEGQTSPPGTDGKTASIPLPHPLLPVTATIGGKDALVQYAGGAPGFVAGLMQVNVQIPEGVEGVALAVVIRVGQFRSQPDVHMVIVGN